jgi:folate-dependent phosphoribosylglycinamide formyltransferase PurN
MSKEDSEPIRVCLLVDGNTIREWQHAAIQRMLAETTAEITIVIKNEQERSRSKLELLKRAIELREWTAVWLIQSLFAKPVPLNGDIQLNDCEYVSEANYISCVPETVDGWKNKIPSDIVAEAVEEADVAVRFGFGFLVGDILTELEHGVLSYHHGDFQEYRGQPAGGWEFIHGKSEAGITLQRINEQLDGGEVVTMKRVSIEDARTHSEIRGKLYENSEDMLATAISKIESGQTEFDVIDDLGPLYSIPSGIPALRFLYKELRGYLRQRRES